jgi:hypothetical protein
MAPARRSIATLYIRQQIAMGVAGIPRGGAIEQPAGPQTPPYVNDWGALQPDQIRILVQELPKLKESSPGVPFRVMENDNVGYNYWRQFEGVCPTKWD